MKVNWDDDRDVAVETAHRPVGQRATVRPTRPTLPRPRDFADAMTLVSPDAVAETIACGPDADGHAAKVEAYATHASTTSTSS